MAFRDVKGQDRAVEFLRNAVHNNKLAHAYLFVGLEDMAKASFARNLAKFLNCENPVKKDSFLMDCCDSCTSCRKIESFNHPDVHWIEAVGRAKRISIGEIRLLQKEISLKAYEGKVKVFVILEAQNMTAEAANALLKTLEEPPQSSLIILISENTGGLLPTVISRCQLIKFYPPDYEKLDTRALGKKRRIIEQLTKFDQRFSSINIFDLGDKRELSNQIKSLLHWFRDILIFKIGLGPSYIINGDCIEEIEKRAELFELPELEHIITQIDKTHSLIAQNVNPKIALEVMLKGIRKAKK